MKILKKGDPYPCCGRPIQSGDPDLLLVLSWVADKKRLPTVKEVVDLYNMTHPPEAA